VEAMVDQAVGTVAHAGLRLHRRYRLDSLIATGGMGSVWAAEDLLLGRQVAVKVLGLAPGDPLAAERVRREARAAAGLRHPNVACVYDYGHQDGLDYLVMELLEGESLAGRLHRLGAPRPEDAAWIAAEVAGALDAAHRAGIVHRDVKPGNIVLTGDGEVKLVDFGIAASAGQRGAPGRDGLVGTAPYLAPECALGAPADPASDVYALGVVVYEMLAGRPPFTGESVAAVAAAHVHKPPPPLATLAPGVPPAMVAVCERALAKDPADRPPSAGAFAGQLTAAVAVRAPGLPTRAAPPSTAPAPHTTAAWATAPGPLGPPYPPRPQGPGSGRGQHPGTVPTWRAAPTVQGLAPVSPRRRRAAAGRRPTRGRWWSAAAAMVAVLALVAALQGFGMLEDLLGVGGTSGGPSIQQPLDGSGGAGDPTAGDATGGDGSGSAPTTSRDHGGDGGDSRSGDQSDQGGGDRSNRGDDHGGPGRGGSAG
jgi:eukaryotic-like serine/threonine-protein kinase